MLSDQIIQIIKNTTPFVGEHIEKIINLFYLNMLEENKELNNIFNRTNQITGQQQKALVHSVVQYAINIDKLDNLSHLVTKITNKHASLNVKPEQYKIVGNHLIKAIKQVSKDILGCDLDKEVVDAWIQAYNNLANIFIDAEKLLYSNSIVNDGWIDYKEFTVIKKVKESEEVDSFYLVPSDNSKIPNFIPGQFISVKVFLPDLGYEQIRQYSLSDQPNNNYLRISVKKDYIHQNESSKCMVSHYLHNNIIENKKIMITAPYGDFFLKTSEEPVVLISAGIGITPMISMVNYIATKETHRNVLFIHSVRSKEAHSFRQHIENLTQENSKISKIFYSDSALNMDQYDYIGQMNLQLIKTLLPINGNYYICGPKEFIKTQISTLEQFGIMRNNIYFEMFSPDLLV